ncbi:O-methyltransferase [Demequina sp.]|uniref:O-methyltransferase n=1 Tax=Demequina sp. TaxID=2050685 RepID=UPI003D0A91F2
MSRATDLNGAERWAAVDAYIEDHYTRSDAVAATVLENQRSAGLPDIAVSPAQGKLLSVLARACDARRVLEFGTLGGYSTLWFARAVGPEGAVVTFELEQHHADVAMASLTQAGVGERVEVRVGPAVDNLSTLEGDDPFDLVFIDADKPNNLAYYQAAMTRVHPGTVIIVDNVVRDGGLIDADSEDPRIKGSRAIVEFVGADVRVEASVVQTVGAKFYDGMVIATVL